MTPEQKIERLIQLLEAELKEYTDNDGEDTAYLDGKIAGARDALNALNS